MGSCNFISSTEGAQRCLNAITFPATKQEILSSIENNEGPEAVIVAANQLPDMIYQDLDELIKYLNAE
ncbi:MAG: DUF2795 domain-containing protein [Armatimonadota bacterium]